MNAPTGAPSGGSTTGRGTRSVASVSIGDSSVGAAAGSSSSEDTRHLATHDVDACAGELLGHVARDRRGDEAGNTVAAAKGQRGAPARQVIITAAVPGDVPEQLAGARVDVMGGEV